ncbi:MAG: tetratricopeptide repeat protein [Gemmatimonadota bacterium]
MKFVPAAAIAALLIGAAPVHAAPQSVRGISDLPEVDRLAEGDALHRGLRPLEALDVFAEILEVDPHHFGALWRSARSSVSLGMLAPSESARQQRYREAEGYARRALDVDADRAEGHLWLSIALGRRALNEGIRTRIGLAREARGEARFVLEADPQNAGAHHVLGQWHAEVMRAAGISRFVARRLLGGRELDEASWEAAEEHLLEAVRLAPETLIHHLELGRLYLDTKRPDEARSELREVLERPALEPTDPLHKQKAQDLLRALS